MQISQHFYVNQKISRGLALVVHLSTITADFKTLGRERRHSPAALKNEVLDDASYPWSSPLPPIPAFSLMHFLQTNNFSKEYFEHILILLFSFTRVKGFHRTHQKPIAVVSENGEICFEQLFSQINKSNLLLVI